jgi:WD40 repeat protein
MGRCGECRWAAVGVARRIKDIYLWDMTTGKFLRQLTGHTNDVKSVAISPDGQTLASGSYDNTVRLWDVATGRELRQLTGHTEGVIAWP